MEGTKKVIIYGVGGPGREKVEQFLSSKYEIVGYSDSSDLYLDTEWYEYKKFYRPQELAKAKVDYIIVAIKSYSVSQSVCKDLIKLGVERSKIVLAADLFLSVYGFEMPIMDYVKLPPDFEGVCLGMSYSKNVLFTHLMKKKFFKLSYQGADMYYHYKNVEWILKHSPQHLESLNYILIDIPYYILNYDLSDKEHFLPKRFPMLECFGDFHNMELTEENKILLEEYELMKDMFRMNYQKNKSCVSNNYENLSVNFSEAKGLMQWVEVFFKKINSERVAENAMLLEKIIHMIFKANPKVKVAIIVFPALKEYFEHISQEIETMKEVFYTEIEKVKEKYPLQIFDFSDDTDFQDKSLYFDAIHLNREGGILFTKKLEEKLQDKFY